MFITADGRTITPDGRDISGLITSPKPSYSDFYMVNSMYGLPKLRIPSHLRVKDVIFNDPATIVFWEDGTKTVVKAVNEDFDPEKGLAMAFTKKALGNQGNYFNQLKKWIPTKEEETDA